jgi:uncharacterized membrane protein
MAYTETTHAHTSDNGSQPQEPVWTFRGYELRPSEFNTAMSHFYRGEVQRANVWRNRLDNTTNWAVIAAGAAISFALSDPNHHYGVIILDTLLVALFLWIEARRYRYYELWSYRVRLMETDFFAAMLVPPFAPHPEWAECLAESLLHPEFPISMWEAFGRRFRRNYMWIFLVLAIAWALKGFLHPVPTSSWVDFLERSAMGPIPGWVMVAAGLIFNGALFLVGFATTGLTQASGEVLPKFGESSVLSGLWHAMETHDTPNGSQVRRTPRNLRRRQQLLAMIITSQPQATADHVLKDMKRGVTALHGRGMYTQEEREVLMVATTVTEMAQLKALVHAEDPNAFVVVTQAQEVLGQGFQPLAA